jgi:hypothetical protein
MILIITIIDNIPHSGHIVPRNMGILVMAVCTFTPSRSLRSFSN